MIEFCPLLNKQSYFPFNLITYLIWIAEKMYISALPTYQFLLDDALWLCCWALVRSSHWIEKRKKICRRQKKLMVSVSKIILCDALLYALIKIKMTWMMMWMKENSRNILSGEQFYRFIGSPRRRNPALIMGLEPKCQYLHSYGIGYIISLTWYGMVM